MTTLLNNLQDTSDFNSASFQNSEFYALAQALGHDLEKLSEGEECCTYIEIPTLEEARDLLSRATPEERVVRQQTFFHPAIAMRHRLGQGLHDRGEAMVFANGTLDPADKHSQSNHLPMHVKAISVAQKTIHSGETWDVSVRGDIWGFDEMEELYAMVNVGTLILENGASIAIQGNVFSLVCQEVIAEENARINILPTPFSVDYGAGPMDGPDGIP
ncbi:TPA: hypothetical protein DDW35_11320, partial [Candidatus Sumerlaeota bacterium]|nr:hypothetical protein [Candidatus Sumerlaeota bacterium]